MLKKLIPVLLCMILAFSCFPVNAAEKGLKIKLAAPCAVLMEAGTGKILVEKNAHQKHACASVTKVMTLLLTMEAVDSGKLKLTDTLTTSAHAASMGGSDIWLEEGEEMTVDDLIKATTVASANDAAVVLAEAICGSEEAFVDRMNKKAKSLGMYDTLFKNCNGLDEKDHLTSAYDVAVMSAELIKHKKIFKYTSIWLDNLRGGKTQIVNTNKLLKTYNGITGLKTGTTNDAGCCMSATAERDGLSLIAVVLGCKTGTERFADSAALLDFGFTNYEVKTLELPDEANGDVAVNGGMVESVKAECPPAGYVVIPKLGDAKLIRECKLKNDLQAPVKIGDTIGEVCYYSGKELLKTCTIKAAENVEKMTFSSVLGLVLDSLFRV